MATHKAPAEYNRPPTHWPFPMLGRNTFLLFGLFLLAITLLPFWGSIVVAGVFALGLQGIVKRVAKWLGNRRRLTSALFVAVLSILLIFPAGAFGLRVYQTVAGSKSQNVSGMFSERTLNKISAAMEKGQSWVVRAGVGANIFRDGGEARETIRQTTANAGKQVLTVLSAALMTLPELFLTVFVFGLFLYLFLSYPGQIKRFAFRLHLFRPYDLKRAIRILKESSYNSLVANFFVAALQSSIITIGARVVGYNESVLIFSTVFALSYIPFIGSAPLGYLLAILSFVTGNIADGFIMVGVATFAGLIDNFLRPYLISNGAVEVHPVLSFASIIGAIGIFGIKGIFVGPVIVTGTVALLGSVNGRRAAASTKKPPGAIVHRLRNKSRINRENDRQATP